jgi:hypothetical protein
LSSGRLARWSPISGIVFVALYVVSGAIFSNEPGPGAGDATTLAYYADDGNQLKLEVAFLLASIAAPFFLWFTASLSARLRQAEGESGWLSRVVLVSGGAFAAVMLVGAAAYQFASDAVDDNPDRFQLDPNVARLLNNAAYTLSSEAAFPLAAPIVLAASLVFLRTALLPRWLGWVGLGVTLGCMLGFIGGGTLFLVWILVVAGYLMRREPVRAPSARVESG